MFCLFCAATTEFGEFLWFKPAAGDATQEKCFVCVGAFLHTNARKTSLARPFNVEARDFIDVRSIESLGNFGAYA